MSPIVILVRPQMGENIGMSARAMGNCGLDTLRIVSPRDGWPSASALAAARGAVGIVEGARVFGSVGEAVSDCTRVMATSARLRDRNVCVYSPEAAVLSMRDSMMGEQAGGGKGGVRGEVRGGLMIGFVVVFCLDLRITGWIMRICLMRTGLYGRIWRRGFVR